MTGARYEITVDSVGRTNRDARQIAIEAANLLTQQKSRMGRLIAERPILPRREIGVLIVE
jgi:hypothetical protein